MGLQIVTFWTPQLQKIILRNERAPRLLFVSISITGGLASVTDGHKLRYSALLFCGQIQLYLYVVPAAS